MKQNYRSGRDLEWVYRKRLEANGFTVMRSAGSKGPFDLIAWEREICHHIQLKRRSTCNAADKLLATLSVPWGCCASVVHLPASAERLQ